jgi:hypothetical protein
MILDKKDVHILYTQLPPDRLAFLANLESLVVEEPLVSEECDAEL